MTVGESMLHTLGTLIFLLQSLNRARQVWIVHGAVNDLITDGKVLA